MAEMAYRYNKVSKTLITKTLNLPLQYRHILYFNHWLWNVRSNGRYPCAFPAGHNHYFHLLFHTYLYIFVLSLIRNHLFCYCVYSKGIKAKLLKQFPRRS